MFCRPEKQVGSPKFPSYANIAKTSEKAKFRLWKVSWVLLESFGFRQPLLNDRLEIS